MRVNVQYLQEDPKTGVLRYRRSIPPRLRPFAGENGKPLSEYKVSLHARDLNEPGAKSRHADAQRRYDLIIARAQKRADGSFDALDAPLIRYLADNFLQRHLEIDESSRWRLPSPDFPFETRRDREADYEECRVLLEDYDLPGLVRYWREYALAYGEAYGYTFDPSAPSFAILCRALGEAACELWLEVERRNDGTALALSSSGAPAQQAAVSASSTKAAEVAPKDDGRSFEQIALELLDNPRIGIGEGAAGHLRTGLRFIREVYGNPSPAQITRSSVSNLLDLMAQRPAKVAKGERDLGLPELAKLYRGRDDVPRMTPRTMDVRLSALSTAWKIAVKNGDIPQGLENPFPGHELGKQVKGPKVANGFTVGEMRAYFSMPVFQSGERPVRGRGETVFWLPLIALFTGARPEEIAQLLVSDIFKDEDDGRWVIRFTDEGMHPHKGKQSLKTERHESGRRTFPVPQSLLDLGLLDYRQYLKDLGEEALFPKLRRKGKRPGLYDCFGGWYCEYIYSHGVLPRDAKRKPVREWRDTWTTAARASDVQQDARDYLQGHVSPEGKRTNDVYGARAVLGDQIDRFRVIDKKKQELDVVALVPRWKRPEI